MNRTKGILIVAAVLPLIALLLARSGDRSGPPTPEPPSPAPPTATGPVTINARPSGTHLLQRGSGELYLDIELTAPELKASKRLPLNIGLVVDRSGSMAGQKLAHARDAARQLVRRLRDGDRIAIITYGSDVTTLVPSTVVDSASREQILRTINTITDRGGTFLSGGLELARTEVLRHGRSGRVNRVLLIGDGQANEGLTSISELSALSRRTLTSGIHVTTMGVGLDFNEEVMTAMAEHGGGHYYFIQNSAAMARFFADELDTMTSIVGKSATLTLELAPGVSLERVYGYTFTREGRTVSIALPDVYGGQQRKIMCKLRVPTDRAGKLAVGRVRLTYDHPDSGARQRALASTGVMVTGDERAVEDNVNPAVMAKLAQVEAAETMREAMKAYSRGDVARSQALLGKRLRRTRSAARRYKSKKLRKLAGEMEQQIEGTAAAAPSSAAGRGLIKAGKYRAYKLAK